MTKKMLIVCGPANTGKSSSIKAAFNSLLGWALRAQSPRDVKYLRNSDREVVATIRIGSELIGLSSLGDVAGEVKKALTFLTNEDCKVIVCATRSRGKPLETARQIGGKNGYAIEEWPKPRDVRAFDAANSSFASAIQKWVVRAGGW